MESITPLCFKDNKLHLLDQRLLPLTEQWNTYDNHNDVAKAITTMVVRGAPAIGCTAAWGFYLGVQNLDRWPSSQKEFSHITNPISTTLAKTRPTAVNLFWALKAMGEIPWSPEREVTLSALSKKAETIAIEDLAACKAMGANGLSALPKGNISVLTHCNAGALATAGYGTALGVIRSLHAAGRLVMAYADDTRPRQQGARLTVWELMKDKVPVTLIPDTAAGYLMSMGKVQAVVVGADRITANGDVANKIGTFMVAMAAKEHHIPFYVAAPLSTFDFDLASGDLIEIEERDADEVRKVGDQYRTPKDAPVFNPAFDVTPARFVTGIITEHGVIHNPGKESLHNFRNNL